MGGLQANWRFHCSTCSFDACGNAEGGIGCNMVSSAVSAQQAVKAAAAPTAPTSGADGAAAPPPPGTPSRAPSTPQARTPRTPGGSGPKSVETLRELNPLLDEGLITEKDYAQSKSAMLSGLIADSATEYP